MIVQKEFLNKLKDFGLNTYESKLWTALLSRGISTAGELSDIANVPRSRSYDVLESLEKKGFIIMKLGKPIRYVAVPPEEILERVKRNIKEEADRQTQQLDTLKQSELLQELNMLHSQGIEMVDPTDISGSLKGRSNLYDHLSFMIKSAQTSIDIITTREGLLRKTETLKNELNKAKDKGVTIRILAPLDTKEVQQAARELKDIAEVKHYEDIRSRMCLIDGQSLIFMLLDDEKVHPSYDTGIWANTPFFTQSLQHLFNTQWKDAKKASN